MTTTTTTTTTTNGLDFWDAFRTGVEKIFEQWTVLRLASENEWGGHNTDQKIQSLVDHVLTSLFFHPLSKGKEPDFYEVYAYLEDYLSEQLRCTTDEGIIDEVCDIFEQLLAECRSGDYSRVEKLLALSPKNEVAPRDETHPMDTSEVETSNTGVNTNTNTNINEHEDWTTVTSKKKKKKTN